MTEAERDICKIYLEDLADLNKSHSCNEYKMLMGMLDAEPCKDTISRQAAIDLYEQFQPYIAVKAVDFGKALEQLPSAQPELDSEALIHTIEMGITATNSMDVYSLGMRNGMRWCKSLIDGVEPKFEKFEADMRGEKCE